MLTWVVHTLDVNTVIRVKLTYRCLYQLDLNNAIAFHPDNGTGNISGFVYSAALKDSFKDVSDGKWW